MNETTADSVSISIHIVFTSNIAEPQRVEALRPRTGRSRTRKQTPTDTPNNVTLRIPAELVARWKRQLETPFAELPDSEQESDREQVLRYLPTVVDVAHGEGRWKQTPREDA